LGKYCGKNYNVKKCRKYLLETRDLSKKDERCERLYKKYHFVPKKEKDSNSEKKDNDSNSDTNNTETKEEVTLGINYAGGKSDDKYIVGLDSGMTVMDIMRKAKNDGLSYDESSSWPGYIQEINGVREDVSKNVFWMLYYNGEMASEGASTLRVKSGDRVEWKYMEMAW
jgi:hypothetical protein